MENFISLALSGKHSVLHLNLLTPDLMNDYATNKNSAFRIREQDFILLVQDSMLPLTESLPTSD
jgi:hypothetical protein